MVRPSFPVFSGGGQLLPQQDPENTIAAHPIAQYRPVSEGLAITPTVSVVIPARNEAANLPHVFGTLPSWVNEIILVDGHSVDDTVAVARRLCPAVKVVPQSGRGKGDALHAGFTAATGDILVMIDADGSTDGAEMIRFVGALLAGADFAKGSRFSSSGGSDDITGVRRYGNRALSVMVNWMFGTHFTDLCYGYNAFWARHLDAIGISSCPGFEVETLMNIRAAKAGLTIYEVPSHECPRIFGASNLHAVRDGWRILKVILRERLSQGRRRDRGHQAAPPPAVSHRPAASSATGPFRLPGPDREPSVRDRDIVAAIAEGDDLGVAAAFGRYAQGLYAYCRSQLTEPAAAASAVQDTFVVALAGARRLKRPDRLRAWLFALARNECQRRLQAAGPSARLYEGAHAMQDTGTFGVITPDGETRALVRAAIAELDPVDGEISELHLRHGFYGADLADIVGVSRGQAHTLAARARSRFEKSLGVLLLARSERQHCRELSAIFGDEGGATRALRRRVKQHIGRCEVCGVRKRGGLNPAILLGLLPAVPMPAELRRQTLRLIADRSPAAATYRAQVMDRAAPSHADGFPTQVTTLAAPGLRSAAVVAVVAAAVALVLLGGAMYYAGHPSGSQAAARVAAGRRLPVTGSTGSADPARGLSGTPSATARPSGRGSGLVVVPGPGGSVPGPLLGLGGSRTIQPPSPTVMANSPSRSPSPRTSPSPARSPSPSSSSAPPSSAPPSSAPPSSAPPSSAPPSSAPPSSAPPSSPDPSSPSSSSAPPTDTPPSASASASPSAPGGIPG
jgi:DNA-directed RNA polymerase specialized sigma24 family protein